MLSQTTNSHQQAPSDFFRQEAEEFLRVAEQLGKKIVNGEATLNDQITLLKSPSPAVRNRLAQLSGFEIFKSGVYEEHLDLLEKLFAYQQGVRDPATSQIVAILKLFSKHIRCPFPKLWLQLPGAWFDIRRHVKSGSPLRPQTLQIHDKHLFALLRMTRSLEKLSPVIAERFHISAQTKHDSFCGKYRKACSKKPDTRLENLMTDLQWKQLREYLLEWWLELPGLEPRVGFCDFTYSAIGQFCNFIFDPEGKRTDDPFEWEKVRNAVRGLNLVRREPLSVSAVEWDGKEWAWLMNGKRVVITRR